MNKKWKSVVFWSIIVLLVLIGIVLMARPIPQTVDMNESEESQLTDVGEKIFDFGTISMADGKVEHDFKITNTSDDTLKIEKLYTSCACTEATLTAGLDQFGPFGMPGHGVIPRIGKKLLSGEEATVTAIYDPAAHGPAGIGPVDRKVFLETSSGKLEFRINATVTP